MRRCLALAGLTIILPAALASCRRPSGSGLSIHADDAAAPLPAVSALRDASSPSVPPPSAPAGPLLGAAIRAQCVVERNVLRRWGVHISKQTGKAPATVTFPEDVTRLACGNEHVCVVSGGDVYCFGWGGFGELGISCAGRRDDCVNMPPVKVQGLPKMIDVAVEVSASCAVSEGGEVYCWGRSTRLLMEGGDAEALPPPESPPLPRARPRRHPAHRSHRRYRLCPRRFRRRLVLGEQRVWRAGQGHDLEAQCPTGARGIPPRSLGDCRKPQRCVCSRLG